MKFLSFCFFVAICSTTTSLVQARLTVSVYYECLCPDSIRFINNQLYPTHQALGRHFNVEFKPFGFAEWTEKPDGGYDFTCQHGPQECEGNLYQACLLNLPSLVHNDYVKLIDCIEAETHPEEATQICMERCGIIFPSYEDVNQCHKTTQGETILHAIGVETKSLEPKVNYVPWVMFNGEWKEEWQNQAEGNLKNLLCEEFLPDVPECSHIKNA